MTSFLDTASRLSAIGQVTLIVCCTFIASMAMYFIYKLLKD